MTRSLAALLGLSALCAAGAACAATTVPVPRAYAPYVYRVTASGADSYHVIAQTGFINADGAARIIRPLCVAQGKTPVGHRPSTVVIGNGGAEAITALSWRVHCA
ncbi:hypothetical protein V8J36_05585 [Frigidibacter sp. MR17.14]|uniref:hypothetical protein n=1 Tax=Frigidibacter sp. MR17.14 TaxID=3126509 RepID=UPI0030129D18